MNAMRTLAATACFAVLCLPRAAFSSLQTPVFVHVDSITIGTSPTKGNRVRGIAVVVIVDDLGQPVASVRVTGTFTGDLNETVTARTTFDGRVVVVTSGDARLREGLTFCVEEVVHVTLLHDAAEDAETCESTGAAGGGKGRRGPKE